MRDAEAIIHEEFLVQQRRGKEWTAKQSLKGKVAKTCYTCGGQHYARQCTETICHYCGKVGHLARECSFGTSLKPEDRFVLCLASPLDPPPCDAVAMQLTGSACLQLVSTASCFVRSFIMPLHGASTSFDPNASLCEGRVDVGCRAVTAALFRSESYRRNTEIRLTFCRAVDAAVEPPQIGLAEAAEARAAAEDGEAGSITERLSQDSVEQLPHGTSVVISGGLVRGLQPHEHAVALRLRLALDSKATGVAESGSLRSSQGLRCVAGGLKDSLADALRFCDAGSAVLLLCYDGMHILEAMRLLQSKLSGNGPCERPQQVTVLLGDHKGLTSAEEEACTRVVKQANCELIRCCLGSATLLGSHCITICHHYMDTFLHCCPDKLFEVHPDVAKMRKQHQGRARVVKQHKKGSEETL